MLSPSLEDYLESIWLIKKRKGIVRIKDIMEFTGYKVSSVNRAVKKLVEKGLVVHEKYDYVDLTSEGVRLAEDIYKKHELLFRFFHDVLGVDEDTALKDACEIEHHLSHRTYEKLRDFVREWLGRAEDETLRGSAGSEGQGG